MCEFKNKFDRHVDGDLIDHYRCGDCRKPEATRMILDTVPLVRVPFKWCREKVTVRIEGLNFDMTERCFMERSVEVRGNQFFLFLVSVLVLPVRRAGNFR